MEVNDIVRKRLIIRYVCSDVSIAKCAVLTQVCCISRISGKYSTLGQIQHAAAFQVYNMDIKAHFSL